MRCLTSGHLGCESAGCWLILTGPTPLTSSRSGWYLCVHAAGRTRFAARDGFSRYSLTSVSMSACSNFLLPSRSNSSNNSFLLLASTLRAKARYFPPFRCILLLFGARVSNAVLFWFRKTPFLILSSTLRVDPLGPAVGWKFREAQSPLLVTGRALHRSVPVPKRQWQSVFWPVGLFE